MKYRSTTNFDRDFSRLPREHRKLFSAALHDHFLPALAAGALSGSPDWPRRLRIHRLTDSSIYSLTWNFTSPDGRATFHLDQSDDGKAILTWRRIGDHSIYRQP